MKSLLRLSAALLATAVLALPLPAAAAGPPVPSFYVNGVLYATIGTPTDFSNTGAPLSSFDTIYNFFGAQQYNVATSAPGMPGFNGGRWQVHKIVFSNYAAALAVHDLDHSGNFDSAAEVQAALADGSATDLGVVKLFECTVNRIP